MKLSILLFAGAVLCSTVLRAAPLPIYSNFGGGYGAGSPLGVDIADGVSFIAPSTGLDGFTYALSSLEFVAYTTTTDANPATISLYDSLGGLPNQALESLTATLAVFDSESPLSDYLVTVNSVLNPHLTAGQKYWIVLSDPLSFDVTWVADGNGATNPANFVDNEDQVGWVLLGESYTQGAVVVNADIAPDVAPEPGTFLGLGTGLAVVVCLGRRKSRAAQAPRQS
jgi:hypothetical protein